MLLDPTHFRVIFIEETHWFECDFSYKYRCYTWTALMANVSIRKRCSLLRISEILEQHEDCYLKNASRRSIFETNFADIFWRYSYCLRDTVLCNAQASTTFHEKIHKTVLAPSRRKSKSIEIRENSYLARAVMHGGWITYLTQSRHALINLYLRRILPSHSFFPKIVILSESSYKQNLHKTRRNVLQSNKY